MKNNKGVTLIALIITIIVLLILAGVGITMVTGQNGIMNRAKDAKEATALKSAEEKVNLATSGAIAKSNYGELTVENLRSEIANYQGEITEDTNGDFPVIVTVDGRSFKVYKSGKVTKNGDTTASDIFDETGKEEGMLHIGDFVNYTPANNTWTDDDFNKIKETGAKIEANNSTELPEESFQFGGFKKGASKSGNATPYMSRYNYVQDASTEKAVTGWRLLDVEDGKMVLISAGCPEDYYHPYDETIESAYVSEYILTGNINSNATGLDFESKYTPRDWSMYGNSKYKSTKTTILTKTKLENWFEKYITNGQQAALWHNNDLFSKIYNTQYESLIDNYAYYYLGTPYSESYLMSVSPEYNWVYCDWNDGAFGVRILVYLDSSVKLSETNSETKTIESRDKTYTYQVWNLES